MRILELKHNISVCNMEKKNEFNIHEKFFLIPHNQLSCFIVTIVMPADAHMCL